MQTLQGWWHAMIDSVEADASKLKFPLPLVITIACGVLATAGSFWVVTAGIRSDIRNINTIMQMQQQMWQDRQALEVERQKSIIDKLGELQRKQDLQAYELTRLNEKVTEKGR